MRCSFSCSNSTLILKNEARIACQSTHSLKVIEQNFKRVPDDERRKMFCDNVMSFFHLNQGTIKTALGTLNEEVLLRELMWSDEYEGRALHARFSFLKMRGAA
jgi:hypothetical protein